MKPPNDAPYRNEVDALRERRSSLEQEAARLREQTRELDALRAREAEIARELASIDGRLGRRSLPLLDQVRVASPCNASWDEMLGDDRTRFCLSCEKNVHNISAMPREEAEQFLRERAGTNVCVRYFQRADGTILTEDCPVGVKKKRRKKIALAVAGAGAMALAGMSMLTKTQGEISPPTRAIAGGMMVPPEPPPENVQGEMKMGDWAAPPAFTAPPPEEPRPEAPRMGRVKMR